MTRLIYIAGILLILGFILSFRSPLPSIFGTATAPVPADELLTLNPE